MTLRISFSPYTTASLTAAIEFTTSHSLNSVFDSVWDHRPDSARMPSIDLILPLINLAVTHEDSDAFLLPVDPILDSALDYREKISRPIDLQTIRQNAQSQKYTDFSAFIDDFDLLIRNAVTYNPAIHRVHQAALRLQRYVRQQLRDIESGQFRPRSDFPRLEEAAGFKIGQAHTKLRRRKREAESRMAHEAISRLETPRPKRTAPMEVGTLADDLLKLENGHLVAVAEILAKQSFEKIELPLRVNLNECDPGVIDKLKEYVRIVRENGASEKFCYAWRPHLPAELQEVRDSYEAALAEWLKPPADVPEKR
jgi:hypothetical protein